MLDKNILSQLSQLKSDIQAAKDYATGTVAGTSGRFGFVRLEDGRDAFLSPDKMQHVIPGDTVKVSITTNDKGQIEGHLEALLEQALSRFLGQYRVSKKGHFVVPLGESTDLKAGAVNRWIFLPPKARGRCKDGDLVVARILQHPFKDGKASAKILERVGQETEPYIERRFVAAKYDLSPRYNEAAQKQTKGIENTIQKEDFGENREDLTSLPFITIDAATTRDMDDALALEVSETSDGKTFTLHVAIADPAAFIAENSSLAQYTERAGQSLYLLGGSIAMLPETLSNGCFSLQPEEKRPALVCSQVFDAQGVLQSFTFKKALIVSQHKLSYDNVASLLAGKEAEETTALPSEIKHMLSELEALAKLRHSFRREHYLVGDEQLEYDIRLSDRGKIDTITPRERNAAQQIVEEAMLSTNICAGTFLKQNSTGLFTIHRGFREDRLGEVIALLKEENIEHGNLLEEAAYLQLQKALAAGEHAPLLSPLRRMMPAAELSLEAGPHLGMGIPNYATVTSPIRRFVDLYNHWAINHILEKTPFTPLTADKLEKLQETLQRGRQADRELYQWLICQFAESLVGTTGMAKIRIVTQQGFGARLLENGIDGFVLFPKKQAKTFDAKRMTLTVNEVTYRLEQEIEVKVESIDMDKRRIAYSINDE